jgi:hypothetical protein
LGREGNEERIGKERGEGDRERERESGSKELVGSERKIQN